MLQYPSAVSVTLYRDGITVDGGFRPFGRVAADAFVADIVDGYFPQDYRETHPNGVVFAPIVDRHRVAHDEAAGACKEGGATKINATEQRTAARRGGRAYAATARAAARRETDCLTLLVRSLDGGSTLHLRALPDDSVRSVLAAVRAEWPALAPVGDDGGGGCRRGGAPLQLTAARAGVAPPAPAWALACDGRTLEGGSATLAEWGLRDRSALRVCERATHSPQK